MAISKRTWLTFEKVVFLLAGIWLVWGAYQFAGAQSSQQSVGKHTVLRPRPERVEVSVKKLARNDRTEMKLFLLGARENPFNVYWHEPTEQIVKRKLKALPGRPIVRLPTVRPPSRPPLPVKPPPPPPIVAKPKGKEPKVVKKPEEKPERPLREPKPYEVPVDYAGWISVGGRMIAHFREKESGQLIQVQQGEMLPDLGLTIVRVARTGVIVENTEGDRFLLREITDAADGGDNGAGGGAPKKSAAGRKRPANAGGRTAVTGARKRPAKGGVKGRDTMTGKGNRPTKGAGRF